LLQPLLQYTKICVLQFFYSKHITVICTQNPVIINWLHTYW